MVKPPDGTRTPPSKAAPFKGRRIVIREEYCMGCHVCEVHCITQHSKSRKIIKAYKSEKRGVSGIVFEERGPASLAVQCRHCSEPLCVEACITGAMKRDKETGRVIHDKDKCAGCWMCVMTCPYGVIKPDLAGKKVAFKCDLCVEQGFPACVEHCPNEAIILVDSTGTRIRR